MPELKICGVTEVDFARYAAERQVDYLGLIFAESSPRFIDCAAAGQIARAVRAVGNKTKLVGVFTTQSLNRIKEIASSVKLDVIQLHGEYSKYEVESIKALGYEVWVLYCGKEILGDATLIDGRRGNESKLADWKLATRLKGENRRVILAGSIGLDNIAEAIDTGADIIDVSSSIESSPGRKNREAFDKFLAAFAAASQ